MSRHNGNNKIPWRAIFRRKHTAEDTPAEEPVSDVALWVEDGAVPLDELPIALALMVESLAAELAPRIAAELSHRLRPTQQPRFDVAEHLKQVIEAAANAERTPGKET